MHQKIGDIRLAQENPNAARVEYQAAVDVCNDLIKLAPNYIGGKEELATSVVRLSQAYAKLQNFPEAEKQLRLSLSIRTELLGKDPNNSTLQSHVATSHITLARLLVQSGDWATALAEFDLGLKIREHLAANDASNLQWQSFLASGYMDKAKLFGQQHDLAAALDTYNKALAIRQRAVRQAPLSVPVRQNLAETESAVAGTLAGLSRQSEAKDARWQEAMKIQTDSLAIWKQLLTELPGNIRVQRNLFANHIALGDMLAAQNDQAGALNEYQEALAIAQPLADKASNSKVWAGNVATAKSLIAKLGAVSGTVH
jgi:tetratricopeptide (TPR) repeat protein